MKATQLLAGLAVGFTLVGCGSTKTQTANKPIRPEVMDLSDSPPAPARKPAPVLETVNPEPAPAPAPTAESGARKHVVAPKDTLYALSQKYYGDSKQWPKIVKANPGLIPEHMPVGKTIVIP